MTHPEFRDYGPAFDPEGRYLYFLSIRTFDPVYDSVQFELSFPRAARPYLIALQAGGRPPFDPVPKGSKPRGTGLGEAEARRRRSAAAGRPRRHRAARRAVSGAEDRFGQIAGAAGNKVLWTVLPIIGAHGRGGHKESPGRLEVFDFATLRAETLLDKADTLCAGRGRRDLVVREGKRLRAISAPRSAGRPRDPETASPTRRRARAAGSISAASASRSSRGSEWRQMLREVWRLQRDQFWVADMSGVDWDAVYRRYEPLLARVATRSELSDLIWEMQGELGTSHAYEIGGDHRRPPPIALGHLAADFALAEDGEQLRDHAHRHRRRVGRERRFAASTRSASRRESASASSPSTASPCRASDRRRRCSSIRPAPRSS